MQSPLGQKSQIKSNEKINEILNIKISDIKIQDKIFSEEQSKQESNISTSEINEIKNYLNITYEVKKECIKIL